jgi:hypothetical protein
MLAPTTGQMSTEHQIGLPYVAEKEVTITVPHPTLAGVADVVSLWGLLRAINALRGKNSPEEFQHALAKTMNLNGALARFVDDDRIE